MSPLWLILIIPASIVGYFFIAALVAAAGSKLFNPESDYDKSMVILSGMVWPIAIPVAALLVLFLACLDMAYKLLRLE